MKKKSLIIAVVAAVFGLQTAHAQYPQLTDEAADKYILDNSDELYNRFYEIYGRFSQWLTKYEL